MTRVTFERICRGVYATADRRFFLEQHGCRPGIWRLCERGQLVGYKPSVSPLARLTSPLWMRSNSARAAVAWARDAINARNGGGDRG